MSIFLTRIARLEFTKIFYEHVHPNGKESHIQSKRYHTVIKLIFQRTSLKWPSSGRPLSGRGWTEKSFQWGDLMRHWYGVLETFVIRKTMSDCDKLFAPPILLVKNEPKVHLSNSFILTVQFQPKLTQWKFLPNLLQ